MIYLKYKPVDLDVYIQDRQQMLFDKLCARWNITEDEYKSFGRCYRNTKVEGYVPEGYVDEKKQYQDLFIDDNIPVTSFFGCDRISDSNGMLHADVHLIFSVNLDKVKQDVEHRADEEVRMDVYKLFTRDSVFAFNEMVIGTDNVFREYTAWKKLIPNRDMQPNHFFRLNFTVKYLPNNNCS